MILERTLKERSEVALTFSFLNYSDTLLPQTSVIEKVGVLDSTTRCRYRK